MEDAVEIAMRKRKIRRRIERESIVNKRARRNERLVLLEIWKQRIRENGSEKAEESGGNDKGVKKGGEGKISRHTKEAEEKDGIERGEK